MTDGQGKDFVSHFPGALVWWLEDDIELCRLIRPRLLAAGWKLTAFQQPEAMLETLEQGGGPDLLILDQRLPQHEGTELLRNLRKQGHVFPVLMLSGRGTAADRILGLEQGAQDYLAKPFHARELLLRCEQLLRSHQCMTVSPSAKELEIHLGDVVFHPHEGILERPGTTEITLTRGERILMLALCRAPGRVLTRQQLAQASGSPVPVGTSRSIDMRLSRLRRLVEVVSDGSLSIETVRTHGYALHIIPTATKR